MNQGTAPAELEQWAGVAKPGLGGEGMHGDL